MEKKASMILISGFVIGLGIIFMYRGGGVQNTPTNTNAVVVKDGVQYITIHAGGGYSPKESTAQAGIPTKLVVQTNGAYDCSSALVIHSLNYQKMLPQIGTETIDVGIPKAGVPLRGVCGMGMYSFVVNFK
ncbi:MAG: hypothetical protein WCQ32_03655 [bacterium]